MIATRTDNSGPQKRSHFRIVLDGRDCVKGLRRQAYSPFGDHNFGRLDGDSYRVAFFKF
jgi:hypothetical protein